MASVTKAIAHQVGRAKAVEADRVRGGVVTVAESKAAEAARTPVDDHLGAWEKALRARGTTPKHGLQSRSRVAKVLELTGATRLADLSAEKVQGALSRLSTPQNARHYLTALRAFVKWCRQTDRLLGDPLRAVRRPAAAGEVFLRQPLLDGQVVALIEATRTRRAKTPFRGHDRAMFYLVMAYTGLRRSEAARGGRSPSKPGTRSTAAATWSTSPRPPSTT
jgi:integrase